MAQPIVHEEVGLRFMCPNCFGGIVVLPQDVACAIFRHGVFKASNEPIPPHAPQAQIEQWLATDAILGCGKPFRITTNNTQAECCDYI